jgi:pyrophosphatase PpaX
MKLKPSAILFDMDGVLVDSLESWWASLNHSLKNFNYKPVTREEFITKYWGHDLYDNLQTMNIPEKVGHFCNTVYSSHIGNIHIYPETQSTLEKLKSYRKTIITNTPKDCTVQILKRFEIDNYFEFVLTSDDVSMAKPNPEIVLKSCELLNVKPKNVVLVGDTDSDVQAGHKAGCKVIGINVKADHTINNVSEITHIVKI